MKLLVHRYDRKRFPAILRWIEAKSPRATHGNTLVMRRSSVPLPQAAQASQGQKRGNLLSWFNEDAALRVEALFEIRGR
jgi:hypothetical protein